MKGSPSDRFPELLHAAGLKITPPRVRILGIFATSREPLSIEDIVKKAGKRFDRVTVYRTIESLKKAGAVIEVPVGHTHAHYELRDEGKHHHHHLICTECGRVEDIENCSLGESMTKRALTRSKYFSKIDRHAFEFYGICKKHTSRR